MCVALVVLYCSNRFILKGNPLMGISRRKHVAKLFSDGRSYGRRKQQYFAKNDELREKRSTSRKVAREISRATQFRPRNTSHDENLASGAKRDARKPVQQARRAPVGGRCAAQNPYIIIMFIITTTTTTTTTTSTTTTTTTTTTTAYPLHPRLNGGARGARQSTQSKLSAIINTTILIIIIDTITITLMMIIISSSTVHAG